MSLAALFPKRLTASIAIPLVALLSGCGAVMTEPDYLQLCADAGDLKYVGAVGGPPVVVLEDPGVIKVMHGSGWATHYGGAVIRVQQRAELPAYANQATVFLNGWELKYAGSDDQRVLAMSTAIARIRIERGELVWDAVGYLSDDGLEEAYEWSYRYTIVAWNDTRLQATVDHNDGEQFCATGEPDGSDNFFRADNSTMTTALSCFPSFLANPAWTTGDGVAVLPRGFGIAWHGSDHDLLQFAYNLESTEPFVQSRDYFKARGEINPLSAPPDGRADRGFVSWKSCAILKDEDSWRSLGFVELVSGLGGSDVGIIEPAFSIQPQASFYAASGPGSLESKQMTIDNIPYAYAIPMLTGWDMHYTTLDAHVHHLGVWLDDLSYETPVVGMPGTLRYTVSSVMMDKEGGPKSEHDHKVSILGLRRLDGRKAPTEPAGAKG